MCTSRSSVQNRERKSKLEAWKIGGEANGLVFEGWVIQDCMGDSRG